MQVAVQHHRLTVHDAHLALIQRIDQDLRQLDTSWKQYDIAILAVSLSKNNLEIEQEKLRADRSDTFEVTRFEADLKATELPRLESQMSYLSVLTEVHFAMSTTLDTWEVLLND
ncbi:TolC family protein [Pantoea sp. App145]|uniref:TolC family protein n=1 Tax=Pantoea sp. App145 TaxID=3071567 RepID=UPI003A8014D6